MQRIGRYEVQIELGRGGFGRVYRAFDPTMGRMVAVKTLTAGGDPELLLRFRNEAASAGKLHHKNIVTIYDFGEHEGEPYIVMELLEGEDLQRIIAAHHPLSLVQKMQIMAEVAQGLQHAHSHGVVHRDVKPANIMVLPTGSVKIMDFGIALVTHAAGTRLTRTGMLPGTLRYMAPEQFRGATNDPLSDIFAYAITYYELLTGQHPFNAATQPAVMYRIMSVDPEPLRTLCPECPEALEQALMRGLQKEREMRYPSLDDMQLDIRPLMLELQQREARNLLAEAKKLADTGQIEAAQSKARESLELDPANAEARQLRRLLQQETEKQLVRPKIEQLLTTGRMKLQAGNYQDAIHNLESALRLDRSNPSILALIDEARSGMRKAEQVRQLLSDGKQAFQEGNLTRAFQKISSAREADPANTETGPLIEEIERQMASRDRERRLQDGLSKARGAILLRSFEQAIQHLAALETEFPGTPEVSELLARARREQLDKQRRENLEIRLQEFRDKIRGGLLAESMEGLEALRHEYPDSEELQNLAAYARSEWQNRMRADAVLRIRDEAHRFLEAQQFDAARRVLEKGLADYPGEDSLSESLRRVTEAGAGHARRAARGQALDNCRSLAAAQRFAEAVQAIDQYTASYGADEEIARLRGQFLEQREVRGRRDSYEQVMERAKALLDRHDPAAALPLLNEALAFVPGDPEASALLSRTQRELEQQRRAADVSRILAEASSLSAQSLYDRALHLLNAGLETYPGDPALLQAREGASQAKSAKDREKARLDAVHKVRQAFAANRFDDALRLIEDTILEYGADGALEALRTQIRKQQSLQKTTDAIRSEWRKQRFPEALQLIEQALAGDPRDATLLELKRQVEADNDRRQKQERIAKVVARSRELSQAKEFDKALELLDHGLAYYPGDAELLVARDLVTTAKSSQERQRSLHSSCAAIEEAFTRMRFDEAIERLNAARTEFGDEPALLDWRRRIDAAREDHRRGQEVVQAIAAAKKQLASGDAEGALEQIDGILRRYPSESTLQAFRAEIYEQARNKRRQRIAAEAEAHAAGGRHQDALRLLDESASQYPGDAHLASLRERIAQEQQAIQRQAERREALVSLQGIFEKLQAGASRKQTRDLTAQAAAIAAAHRDDAEFAALHARIEEILRPRPAPPQPSVPPVASSSRSKKGLWGAGLAALLGAGAFVAYRANSSPDHATVEIRTTPPGASVRVENRSCVTPSCRLDLPFGEHQLEISLSGHKSIRQSFTLTKDQPNPTPIEIVLEAVRTEPPSPPPPAPATPQGILAVSTGIEGVQVLLNGKSYGRTDAQGHLRLTVEARDYSLRAEKHGYRGEPDRHVRVAKDSRQEVALRLTPMDATLVIQGGPPGAQVRQMPEGKAIGTLSKDGSLSVAVPPGERTIEISRDQFVPRQIMKRFEPGETVQLTPAETALTPLPKVADPQAAIAQDWEKARAAQNAAAVEDFLRRHPNSPFTAVAQQVLDDLHWKSVNKGDSASLRDFASRHASSRYAREALQTAARIDWNALDRNNLSALNAYRGLYKDDPDAAARAAREIERLSRPPVPTAPQTSEHSQSERNAIYAALARYTAAFEQKDIDALKAAYPGVPQNSVEGLKRAFTDRNVRMTMSLQTLSDPEIRGNTATLVCQMSTITVQKGRSSNSPPRKVNVILGKKGSIWVIQNIQNSN
ncbi:MAG: protein kinase [Bryobacterales bacterium]|nr:protein kinase [Bryobacterales bacterium]